MRKQFANVGFWEVPIKIDHIVHIYAAYTVFFVFFFNLCFVVCLCVEGKGLFLWVLPCFQIRHASHILDMFFVFSSRCDLRANKVTSFT
jgi:hypothetical protein